MSSCITCCFVIDLCVCSMFFFSILKCIVDAQIIFLQAWLTLRGYLIVDTLRTFHLSSSHQCPGNHLRIFSHHALCLSLCRISWYLAQIDTCFRFTCLPVLLFLYAVLAFSMLYS